MQFTNTLFTNTLFTSTLAAAAAVAAAGSVAILGTPIAAADDLTTTTIGNEARLTDGNIVQGWTISGLKASSDVIPYPVAGTLWEATATDQALAGSATPIVSNLNARSRSGETYRVLFGVATPQGVNPSTLAEGQRTTGKVYFDVVGESPDSVVYNAGGHDLLVWVPAPPPARGGTTPITPYTGGSTTPTTGAAATPAAPTPAAVPGTPAAAASAPGTALPTGSAGTPIPAGSAGTPLAPGSQGTPVAGTPVNPAAPVTPGAPVTAGTPTAPAIAGTEAAPQPAAVQEAPPAPAATGSQGTPLPNGPATAAPTTTVVVPPPA